jgi:hypothetical protein
MSITTRRLDTAELEQRVKRMYEEVALEPEQEFHFETGRALAERLGYPTETLGRWSFAPATSSSRPSRTLSSTASSRTA